MGSPLVLGLVAVLVALYYGTVNLLSGSISALSWGGAAAFFIICGAILLFFIRKDSLPSQRSDRCESGLVAFVTFVIIFSASILSYIPTGKLLGMTVGALVGTLALGGYREVIGRSGLFSGIILGVVALTLVRSVSFDVLTMGSATLEPRVHRGERILVNNLKFGLSVPFIPHHILQWGAPRAGDLVIVLGPNSRPFLREVVAVRGGELLVNIDGWLPREKLIAGAMPLKCVYRIRAWTSK